MHHDPARHVDASGAYGVSVGDGAQQIIIMPPRSPEPSPAAPLGRSASDQRERPAVVSNLGAANVGFVGRETALTQIHEGLCRAGRVVTRPQDPVGGIGKTQLALEYARQHADDYDVLWLVASQNPELIGGHLAELAVRSGLVEPDVTTPAAVEALHVAVSGSRRWLLIFDNAEDPRQLNQWLPPRGGHVIITSRQPGWDEVAIPVEVRLFDRSESVSLLQARLPHLSSQDADRLAAELGDLPLAVAQAAMVLNRTGMSTDDYLDALTRFAHEILDDGTPLNYPRSLAATVHLSAQRLAADNPAAMQLLALCSFLAPEAIPLNMFARAAESLHEPLSSVAQQRRLLPNLATAIGEHGLAATGPHGIQVHRLVQAIIRHHTTPESVGDLRRQATAVVLAAVPADTDDPATWPAWSAAAPHLIAADPATNDDAQLRTAACLLVLQLLRRAETPAALNLARHLYQQWRDHLGPNDIHTLKAATELAHATAMLGDFRAANTMIEDNLTRYRNTFGPDHLDTLRSAQDYAVTMHSLGDYGQARTIEEDVLSRRRRLLGDDHLDTISASANLASTLHSLGDYRQARAMKEDVLSRRGRLLGDDHPDTISASGILAFTLHSLGDYGQARAIEEDVLGRLRRLLGDDHPH
ncbi:FxSxx-COOH system tetratricopeptide repeat protein, partial [Catellatospora coxensis]